MVPRYPYMMRLLLSVGLLLCLTMAMCGDDAEAAPNPIPLSTVTLEQDVYGVTVYPHHPSAIIMQGGVTVEKACMERVVVHLTADSDIGWPLEIVPTIIPFINPRTEQFLVNVTVPPGASPLLFGEVIVTAAVKAPGLGRYVTNTSCLVVPRPYYTSSVEPIGSHFIVGEDDRARLPLRVWNTGTAEDTYTFDLSSTGMEMDDWDGPNELVVPPRSFVEVNVTVHYDEPERPRKIWAVDVDLSSENSTTMVGADMCYVGEPGSVELMVYVRGPVVPIPELSPLMTLLIIQLAVLVSVLVIAFHRSRSRA